MARYRTLFALVAIGGVTHGLGESFEAGPADLERLEANGIPLSEIELLDDSDTDQAKGSKPTAPAASADPGTPDEPPAGPRERVAAAKLKADLVALATEFGVEHPSNATVADLRAALDLHLDALDEGKPTASGLSTDAGKPDEPPAS